MAAPTGNEFTQQVNVKHPLESYLYGMSFSRKLAADENMTGETPVVSISPTGPTLGTPVVNTATFGVVDDNGETLETVAIGEGVQVRISGGTAAQDYEVTISCATSDGNTVAANGILQVRG